MGSGQRGFKKRLSRCPSCCPLVLLLTCPQLCCLKTKRRRRRGGKRGEVRQSHANEEPISRGNKGKKCLLGVPGGGKALTGTGLIKPNSAGSSENRSGLGLAKVRAEEVPAHCGSEATACRAPRPSSGEGAHLRG